MMLNMVFYYKQDKLYESIILRGLLIYILLNNTKV